MSSNYHLLCLSHDPAIVLSEYDFQRADISAVTRAYPGLADHQQCDIMVGRYSYPLVEVGCFGAITLEGPTGCKGYHNGIQWMDRDWLRLLCTVNEHHSVNPQFMSPLTGRCWTPERLRRLAPGLGMNPAMDGPAT